MEEITKNKLYTVIIEGYTSEGFGVCRIDGRAVFVPYTIKGETWRIKILKVSASAIYAKAMECIISSPYRIAPECPHFYQCGGCSMQHMSYEEELSFKLMRVNNALSHIGRQSIKADEIIPAESSSRYRNKAIFNVAQVNGRAVFGFFKERSHSIIEMDDCLIQTKSACECAAAVCDFMNANGIEAFDENTGRGYVKHIFCRTAFNTKDMVLCIISSRGFGGKTDSLVKYILERCPYITGIVLNINKERYNTVLSGSFYTLFGKSDMTDILCSHSFNISPQAFYQINPVQAEKLYNTAISYLDNCNELLELYCGAGTISLSLASKCRHVTAAEIVSEAIENAKINASINGIENVDFICADAAIAAEKYSGQYDCVLVDPPRKGMDEAAVKAVAAINAPSIIYVSCSPETLARDILRFNEYGYELLKVKAVDMFPRTAHCESVAKLIRS